MTVYVCTSATARRRNPRHRVAAVVDARRHRPVVTAADVASVQEELAARAPLPERRVEVVRRHVGGQEATRRAHRVAPSTRVACAHVFCTPPLPPWPLTSATCAPVDLGRAGLAAELAQALDDGRETGGVEPRELASAGVGRDRAVETRRARLDERATLAGPAEAVGLELHDHRDGERVVERGDVDVGRGDARLSVRLRLRGLDVVVEVVDVARPPVADVVPGADAEHTDCGCAQVGRPFDDGDEHARRRRRCRGSSRGAGTGRPPSATPGDPRW